MSSPRIDVYGLGQCSIDYIGMIDGFPPPDVKCEFSNLAVEGGGPVATALVALSRWGRSCYFAGCCGDDDFGEKIRDSLRKENIDLGGMVVRKESRSQFAFITAEPETAQRTIFWQRPTGAPLSPDDLDYEVIGRAKVMHTDGLFIDAALAAAGRAKKEGVALSVDAGTLREGMLDLAALSDFFIASSSFAAQLTEGGPVEACRRIAECGPSVAAVTLGERGYVALAGGAVIERPAYAVRAVDTTGCGDVFHAGFLYGVLEGWGTEKCLDFAAWSAARVSLALGGRKAIPALAEIKEGGY